MVNIKNFSENLEKDFERLTAAIGERQRQESEDRRPEKEIVKKSLEVFWPPEMEAVKSSVPVAPPVAAPTADGGFLPAYMAGDQDDPAAEKKVADLVNLAFQEGLAAAWRMAQRESPFVIDAFHDALTDKLLPELKKRGVIKD